MARGRKKKTVLNQKVEEPIAATPEQIEDIKKEGAKEIAKLVDEKIVDDLKELGGDKPEEISLKVSGEKLAEVLYEGKVGAQVEPEAKVEEDSGEEVVVSKEVSRPIGIRNLDKDVVRSMSSRDLRHFQRTGKLPK